MTKNSTNVADIMPQLWHRNATSVADAMPHAIISKGSIGIPNLGIKNLLVQNPEIQYPRNQNLGLQNRHNFCRSHATNVADDI